MRRIKTLKPHTSLRLRLLSLWVLHEQFHPFPFIRTNASPRFFTVSTFWKGFRNRSASGKSTIDRKSSIDKKSTIDNRQKIDIGIQLQLPQCWSFSVQINKAVIYPATRCSTSIHQKFEITECFSNKDGSNSISSDPTPKFEITECFSKIY